MGIERLQPTEEQRKFFVTAIERDHAVAVAGLIKRFGLELWLTHTRLEPRQTGTIIHKMSGGPLNIAAFLGKDDLAVSLLQQGAQPLTSLASSGTAEDHADGDTNSATCAVIEHAWDNKMPKLARALMEQPGGVDWNYASAVSTRWCSGFADDSLFNKVRRFKDSLEFFGEVGLFAGRVGQNKVRVVKVDGTFEVQLNGSITGYYPTMACGIAAVAKKLGLEPIVPLPPVSLAARMPEASLAQSTSDIADDIPY